VPRRSAASLTVIHPRVNGRVPRLSPPSTLGTAERRLFIALVGSCPAAHFRESDQPLLCQYVMACVAAEHASSKLAETGGPVGGDGEINPWFKVHERAVRMMSVLAMRLRLTPSSRTRPETVARRAGYVPPSYYDTLGDDDA
jgi:hypothetical protein